MRLNNALAPIGLYSTPRKANGLSIGMIIALKITADKIALQNLKKEKYSFENIQIKNPNNPAQLVDCKLITFKVD